MKIFKSLKLNQVTTFLFEVLIIFIGITMSFYFEEWREENERVALQKDYLIRLTNDIDKDIEYCEFITGNSANVQNNYKIALESINGNKEADTIFSYINVTQLFQPNNYTFIEMQNQGIFYSIEDSKLKTQILDFYNSTYYLVEVFEILKKLNTELKEEISKYMKYKNPGSGFLKMEIVSEIKGNLTLYNKLSEVMTYSNFIKNMSQDIIQSGKSLKININNEINHQ